MFPCLSGLCLLLFTKFSWKKKEKGQISSIDFVSSTEVKTDKEHLNSGIPGSLTELVEVDDVGKDDVGKVDGDREHKGRNRGQSEVAEAAADSCRGPQWVHKGPQWVHKGHASAHKGRGWVHRDRGWVRKDRWVAGVAGSRRSTGHRGVGASPRY